MTSYCSKHGFGSNPMNGIIYREIRLDERKKRGESLHMHMTMLGNHKLATATSPTSKFNTLDMIVEGSMTHPCSMASHHYRLTACLHTFNGPADKGSQKRSSGYYFCPPTQFAINNQYQNQPPIFRFCEKLKSSVRPCSMLYISQRNGRQHISPVSFQSCPYCPHN